VNVDVSFQLLSCFVFSFMYIDEIGLQLENFEEKMKKEWQFLRKNYSGITVLVIYWKE
jgi:hypothetical protein